MATSVRPDDFLANVAKWLGPQGGRWRFYKTKADWLVHNRNAAQGFGPLRGAAAHNTASTSQAGMLVYLYNGDAARNLPGPLCNWAILKTGEVVLMGWGTSNATGPGDPRPNALVLTDSMPLTSEIYPATSGPSDPNAIRYAPHYAGWEACHASEGPTAAQYEAVILMACAYLDTLGGFEGQASGGSVVMHRELTRTRSDPQGTPKNGQMRRDINSRLKAGPPKPPEPPVVTKKPTAVTLTCDKDAVTLGESVVINVSASPAIAGVHVLFYKTGSATAWTEFHRIKTANGKGTVTHKPGQNVSYRTSWWPDDAAYEDGEAAYDSVVVVDLVRLLTEHRALQLEVAQLKADDAPAMQPGD